VRNFVLAVFVLLLALPASADDPLRQRADQVIE
jgi:hypothetical protein